jgi:hypothetical protein
MLRRDTARSREFSLATCSANVVEDRTHEVGWVAISSCERKGEVIQPNIEWVDKIRTADSMYSTSRKV